MPTSLNELGYETFQRPETREDMFPEDRRTSGSLEELGYDTTATLEQARSRITQRELKERERFGPQLVAPTGVPAAKIIDERNRTALKNKYGSRFDREEAYANLPVTFDLSRSDRFSEKREKFKSYFPRGDIRQERVGSKNVIIARETPSEPYRIYSDTILADVFSEPTAGAVAGVAGAPVTGGGTLAMAGLTGLGTGLGAAAKYGVEKARGFQETPVDEGMTSAVKMGLYASAIDLATMGAGRVTGIARRTVTPESRRAFIRAEETAERYGLEPLMAGQVTRFPLLPQMFRQAGATTSRVGRAFDRQEMRLLDVTRRMSETDYASVSDKKLGEMLDLQRRELEALFREAPEPSAPGKFGETVQSALERYKITSRKARDRLYRKARVEGDTLQFDIRPAQAAARKYLDGVKRRTASGEEVRAGPQIPQRLENMLRDVAENESTIRTFTDSKGAKQEAIEQLKELRTGFYDLMTEGEGVERRIATEMWSHLKASMESPTAGTTRARDLLRKANRANAVREANLETAAIHKALNHEEPGKLLNYFRPGNQSAIRTIKNLAGKKWTNIKNDFLGTLTQDPRSGLATLNALKKDRGTLREIMSADEETALREYLTQAKKLDDSKLAALNESQVNRMHRVRELTKQGREQLEETIRLSGGSKSQFAQDARLGLIRKALDESTVVSEEGEQILSSKMFLDRLNGILKNDDYAPLITSEFRKTLEDAMAYLAKVRRATTDVGSSMETAGLAAKGKNIFRVAELLAGWSGAAINVTLGRALTRPARFTNLLKGGELIDERNLRIMTQIAKEMNEDAERLEGEAPESATVDIYGSIIGGSE